MDSDHKTKIAKAYLDKFSAEKDAERNRSFLYEQLSHYPDWESNKHRKHISRMLQKDKEAYEFMITEVTRAIEVLPDSRGKVALYLHHLEDEPYKCIAIDMRISERQLMRDINRSLENLGGYLLNLKGEEP